MQKPSSHIEEYQLITYLSGTGDDELSEKVSLWLNESPSNEQYFEEIKKLWEASLDAEMFDQIDVDTNWAAFKQKAKMDEGKVRQMGSGGAIYKVAAALVLLAAVGYLFFGKSDTEDQSPDWIAITADEGSTVTYELPDGSSAWLNEGSELYFELGYGDTQRKVRLKGEAFFEVKENDKIPFVVHLQGTETTVLGTSFNLKGDAEGVSLVLVTGKVELKKDTQTVLLSPGEKAYTTNGGELKKEKNNDPNFDAWKTRTFVFEETPIRDVINLISSVYKTDIDIEDQSFGDCPLTTKFELASLEDILETLTTVFEVELSEESDNKYVFSGTGCQ